MQAVFCGEFAFVGKHVARDGTLGAGKKSGEKPLGAVTLWLKQHRPSLFLCPLLLATPWMVVQVSWLLTISPTCLGLCGPDSLSDRGFP